MKHVGLVVLLCVWFQMSGERAFAQGAGPDHPQLFNQRKEIARQYLLAAGIQAPEQLDLAHLPQLRAEFEKCYVVAHKRVRPRMTNRLLPPLPTVKATTVTLRLLQERS